MSVSKPQNRSEFKQHILTKLGSPVLEVNVSDEQMDIAIDDAFQYFHERNHFNGVERVYISVDLNNPSVRANYSSFDVNFVEQSTGSNQPQRRGASRKQNNFVIMPNDVVGVTKILRGRGGLGGIGGGVIPPGLIAPGLIGSISGNGCDNSGFGLTQYWAFQQYLSMVEFTMFPPKMYSFNQRTHRLHIDGNLNDLGRYLVCECMAKPNPDIFPDLWNDMFLKSFATALVRLQWGQNLTKYSGVNLPGGITMNGERILDDAQKELQEIKTRFSMDWMDPVLDEVG